MLFFKNNFMTASCILFMYLETQVTKDEITCCYYYMFMLAMTHSTICYLQKYLCVSEFSLHVMSLSDFCESLMSFSVFKEFID